MIDLQFAIRDNRRDPNLSSPSSSDLFPPGFEPEPLSPTSGHFYHSSTDPFPDFDVIKEWILEPDCSGMSNEENRPENGGDFEVGRVGEDLGKVSLIGGYGSDVMDRNLGPINDNGDEIDHGDDSSVAVGEIGRDCSKGTVMVDGGPLVKGIDEEMGNGRIGATDDSFSTALSIVDKGPFSENDAESDGNVNKGDREVESDDSSSSSSSEEEEDDGDDSSSDSDIDNENGMSDDEEEFEEGEIRDLDAKKRDEMIGSSDDEEGMRGPVKSKNELEILPPVPPVDVTLELHHQTTPVGAILSLLGSKVIVEGLEKHSPLSEGSILWITETRSPLGLIDEIFGPVKNPYYIVRYNSNEEVPAGIQAGTPVSFVEEFAGYVLNDRSLYKKGYDASGENDEEVFDEVEFSDDEKEAEYKRMQRKAKRGVDDQKNRNREFVDGKNGIRNLDQKNGNREFNQKNRNSEFNDRKRAQNNAHKLEKNSHLASGQPPVLAALEPPAMNSVVPMGPSHVHPNQLQIPPVTGQFGCTSCACSIGNGPSGMIGTMGAPFSHVPLQPGYFGGPPYQVVPMGSNMFWPNGMPYQQHHIGLPNMAQTIAVPCQQQQQHIGFPNGSQMNGMPSEQHQHPCLPVTVQANGIPCQQQQQQQQQHMCIPGGVSLNGQPDHHQQQHTNPHECSPQQQVFSDPSNGSWASGLLYQQQFDPCQRPPGAVWTNGPLLNQAAASSGLPFGQAGFNQALFGMGLLGNPGGNNNLCFGQFPQAIGGNFSAPQQFNPGTFSGHRGRASSQRGRLSGRRGGGQHSAFRNARTVDSSTDTRALPKNNV